MGEFPDEFSRITEALAPFKNVVLLIPAADKAESLRFVHHSSNYQLCQESRLYEGQDTGTDRRCGSESGGADFLTGRQVTQDQSSISGRGLVAFRHALQLLRVHLPLPAARAGVLFPDPESFRADPDDSRGQLRFLRLLELQVPGAAAVLHGGGLLSRDQDSRYPRSGKEKMAPGLLDRRQSRGAGLFQVLQLLHRERLPGRPLVRSRGAAALSGSRSTPSSRSAIRSTSIWGGPSRTGISWRTRGSWRSSRIWSPGR